MKEIESGMSTWPKELGVAYYVQKYYDQNTQEL
jgi:hypothetical protein